MLAIDMLGSWDTRFAAWFLIFLRSVARCQVEIARPRRPDCSV
jgi:hypothetical protein